MKFGGLGPPTSVFTAPDSRLLRVIESGFAFQLRAWGGGYQSVAPFTVVVPLEIEIADSGCVAFKQLGLAASTAIRYTS